MVVGPGAVGSDAGQAVDGGGHRLQHTVHGEALCRHVLALLLGLLLLHSSDGSCALARMHVFRR